jgi:hypothetical protein
VLYDKLGLKEDEKENKAREDNRSKSSWNDKGVEEHSCGDELSDGPCFWGNWKEPVMNLGTRYNDMVTFRLAMRQYAISRTTCSTLSSRPLQPMLFAQTYSSSRRKPAAAMNKYERFKTGANVTNKGNSKENNLQRQPVLCSCT